MDNISNKSKEVSSSKEYSRNIKSMKVNFKKDNDSLISKITAEFELKGSEFKIIQNNEDHMYLQSN